MSGESEPRATVSEVLAVREFRTLWLCYSVSLAGDQLARVALAVLVFTRTGSHSTTAAAYALTFVPALVGGPLLSGLADRHPLRTVLVTGDALRAGAGLLMAVPGTPLPWTAALVVITVLISAPSNAARLATLPAILPGDRYPVGLGIMNMSQQAVQLAGFGAGGALVAAFGPHRAFAVNAATFALSAVVLRAVLEWRPAVSTGAVRASLIGSARRSARLVWTDRRLRYLMALSWLYGFFVVPEALAAPYADQIGAGTTAVGFLMAADPIAAALGTFLIIRCVAPAWRVRLLTPLAIACGLPLVVFLARPGLATALTLLALTGLLSCYMSVVQPLFVRLVPVSERGQAIGLGSGGLLASQGIGILAGGYIADQLGPGAAIALCAAAGVVAAGCLSSGWLRAARDPVPGSVA
ncbi:MFS transporter [Spirillospora sp. CA-294931]|uniref:MFS transporter n=1 Tax=Spirillospora sp. CA-294931 TaxID=3240042 RepID=UPI003D8E1C15